MPRRRVERAIAALAILMACGGCAIGPMNTGPDQSLYQRVGGSAAIRAVVDDAVANISADTRINRRFVNAAAPQLTQHLVDLLCVRTGGPCTYTGRDMAAAHDGMYIRDDEFDALVEDLVKSIDKFRVPPRERAELLAILGQMRNAIVGH